MSASGAKVLMLRSVELARNHGVRIHARSTFSDEQGTWIGEDGMENAIISAVTHNEKEVVFTLTGIPDRPGAAATVFDAVAAEHVNVDTIIQNTDPPDRRAVVLGAVRGRRRGPRRHRVGDGGARRRWRSRRTTTSPRCR